MKSLENLTPQEKFNKIEDIFWKYFAKTNKLKIRLMEIDFEDYEFISLVKQLKEIGLDDFNYIYNKLGELKNDVGCDDNEQEVN